VKIKRGKLRSKWEPARKQANGWVAEEGAGGGGVGAQRHVASTGGLRVIGKNGKKSEKVGQ